MSDEKTVAGMRAELDRMAAGTAELPRGADGEPINVGDVVYGEDGRAWRVRGVTIGAWRAGRAGHYVRAVGDAGEWRYLKPEWLTHGRPDSWGRIADELDAWCDRADAGGRACDEPRSFAVRIRRLAGGEGER
ncbi:MAG: hypothetical protein MR874_04255, partial [Coriobacteriaceae bacterium]|nr:hypothetical protein [Coriobacteriaceae bacterium]